MNFQSQLHKILELPKSPLRRVFEGALVGTFFGALLGLLVLLAGQGDINLSVKFFYTLCFFASIGALIRALWIVFRISAETISESSEILYTALKGILYGTFFGLLIATFLSWSIGGILTLALLGALLGVLWNFDNDFWAYVSFDFLRENYDKEVFGIIYIIIGGAFIGALLAALVGLFVVRFPWWTDPWWVPNSALVGAAKGAFVVTLIWGLCGFLWIRRAFFVELYYWNHLTFFLNILAMHRAGILFVIFTGTFTGALLGALNGVSVRVFIGTLFGALFGALVVSIAVIQTCIESEKMRVESKFESDNEQ